MYKDIRSVEPFLKPFPPSNDVFADRVALHSKHLLPLLSIDASMVSEQTALWLHVVTPIEPFFEGGSVGQYALPNWRELYDCYNQGDWIGFRVGDGKYSFSGDFRYFGYESGAVFDALPGQEKEIHEFYRSRISDHEAARDRFQKDGCLSHPGTSRYRYPLVRQLGGEAVLGNMAEVPSNQSDKPFIFIAEVYEGDYLLLDSDRWITLWYDPEEQIALITFDYT